MLPFLPLRPPPRLPAPSFPSPLSLLSPPRVRSIRGSIVDTRHREEKTREVKNFRGISRKFPDAFDQTPFDSRSNTGILGGAKGAPTTNDVEIGGE